MASPSTMNSIRWWVAVSTFLLIGLNVGVRTIVAARAMISTTRVRSDALPIGADWQCNRAVGGICGRAVQNCSVFGVLFGRARPVADCRRQEYAWCFTYRSVAENKFVADCRHYRSECMGHRPDDLQHRSDVSECVRVGRVETGSASNNTTGTSPAPDVGLRQVGGQSGTSRATGQADCDSLPVGNSPIIGPHSALVTVVEFGDFQCPYCARVAETLRRLRARYRNDIRIVWKNNPLPMHADAEIAAEAAMEAYAQGGNAKFWAMHDWLFENQQHLERADLERYAQQLGLNLTRFRAALDGHTHNAEVTRDQQLAEHLRATGTPTFFINGTQITGAQPYERFEQLVDAVLAHARTIQPTTNAYATMVAAPLPSPDPPPAPPSAAPSPTPDAAPLRRLTPTSVSASSFISNRRNQHAPERAFDGDLATAWNENESGPGDGAWIEATLSGGVTVRRVTLTAGYDSVSPRHGDLFGLNSHLRRVRISFDGAHAVERDVAEDQRALVVDGLNVQTHSLRIEAVSVWAGTRWADLCISEVTIEGDDARGGHGEAGATQPDGAQLGRGDSPAARCTYATHTSFHLRAAPSAGRDGAEEIRSLPVVEVLGAGELRRGRDRIFNVRLLDGSHREGWMFIPTQELGADCAN